MRKRPLCAICLLFLVIQAVRVCFFGAGKYEPSAWEQAAAEEDAVTLTGSVAEIVEKDKVTAVCLKDCLISIPSGTFRQDRLMVYMSRDPGVWDRSGAESGAGSDGEQRGIKIGNQIKVTGEAELFDEARNPGNFDQRAYYARQGIHLLVWADEADILSPETDPVRQFLTRVRSRWNDLLLRHMGEYYGGTMSAILLGEKGGLDPEMKKLYQKNGIGHLLAISGLHMSFIGAGIYSLLRKTGLGFIPAGIAGGGALILYTLMIGAGVSSLRALIMFLVRIGADMTGRDYDLLTSLALSAAVLCAWRPLYLTDAGYQLSFGAILGIALLSPVFAGGTEPGENRRKERGGKPKAGRKILRAVRDSFLSGLAGSCAVNVMLLGPVLYFYFEAPPYSVFLNLIVIPLMPVVMGAGLLGSALALVWEPLGAIILKLGGSVLWGYDCVCAAASLLPGSRFVSGRPGVAWLAVYYMGIALLCGLFYLLRNRREDQRHGLLARSVSGGMILFAASMAVFCRTGYRARDEIRATALDVGQGDCIYIRGEERNYLIDGGSSDVSSVGAYRIEPYLLSNAADTLDYVFITHGDEDHVSGVRELLEGQELGVRVRTLVLPPEEYCDENLLELAETAVQNNTKVVMIKAGQRIEEKSGAEDQEAGSRLVLTCLAPESGKKIEAGNAASLVLSLTYGDFDMLLTGDVEGAGEESLVQSGYLGRYDVLKAAHHGSKNSGTESFLEIVRPSVTLISAGVDNRYGHPHEETLKRLEEAGSKVYSTQESGAVTVRTDGETMEIDKTLE